MHPLRGYQLLQEFLQQAQQTPSKPPQAHVREQSCIPAEAFEYEADQAEACWGDQQVQGFWKPFYILFGRLLEGF